MKKILYILVAAFLFASCDKNDFAKTNQDPSKVNDADLRFLFTKGIGEMTPDSYGSWFYDNAKYILPWSQAMNSNGGNSGPDALTFQEQSGRMKLYEDIMPNMAEIRDIVDNKLKGKDQVAAQRLKALTYPVQIYTAIHRADVFGSIVYTEAVRARYTNPPLLSPKYDTQEFLFDIWIQELNKTIDILTTAQTFEGKEVAQISLGGNQDLFYNGDFAKWAKFANSLKLRIAARLLNSNKVKALDIIKEAVNNPVGLITDVADELVYFNGVKNDNFGDGIWLSSGGKSLIDFLKVNKDPRLRFVFDQNDFNSRVVQQFLNQKKELPSYIKSVANVVDGKFIGWKGAGEPWVRYFGVPLTPDEQEKASVKDEYFNSESFKITIGNSSKVFSPTSRYAEKNIRPHMNLTYADSVGAAVNELKDDDPAYRTILFSAAEVNLMLAEFKLLGAEVPGDANTYFQNGITASVNSMNFIAKNNNILNYDKPFDTDYGVALKLADGEIDALLQNDDYKLNGNNDLEKVYVQQYMSYLMMPNELFVTCRRSGIPKVGSTIFAREAFTKDGKEVVIPRRFAVNYPTEDNINFDNIIKSITDQGFTAGSKDNVVLNTERVWYDKNAPAWGAGPNN